MLITKHGKAGEIKAFKCPKCECEFLANANEYHVDLLDKERKSYCECPECHLMAREADE